jgi:predicted metal-binding membrane protein
LECVGSASKHTRGQPVCASFSAVTSLTRAPQLRANGWLLGLLLAGVALAWVITRQRMLGMDAGPGTDPGALSFYLPSWVLMMAAMMLPSLAPALVAFCSVEQRARLRSAPSAIASAAALAAGYLLSWTLFGLAAYGLLIAVRSLSIPAFSWHEGGPYLTGAVLLAASAYQLTPAKQACLKRCRDGVGPRTGPRREAALLAGIVHGAWCASCCWALMASLFALGLMSITWMIVFAALIAVERLAPGGTATSRLVAVPLAVLALAVALAPGSVPGLTIPGSADAMRATHAMGAGGMEPAAGAPRPMTMP